MLERLNCVCPEVKEPPSPKVSLLMLHTDTKKQNNCCFFVCFCFFGFVSWFSLMSIFSSAGPSDPSWLPFAMGQRPQPLRRGFIETCAVPPGKSQAAPRREWHLQLEPVVVKAGGPMWLVRFLPLNCTFTVFNSLLGFLFLSFPDWTIHFLTVFQKNCSVVVISHQTRKQYAFLFVSDLFTQVLHWNTLLHCK